MPRRYNVVMYAPRGSADGQLAIEDSQSDNGDILVLVDPMEHLAEESRQELAARIAEALNGRHTYGGEFEPKLED